MIALFKKNAVTIEGNLTIIQAFRGIAVIWVVLFHASSGKHLPTLIEAMPSWLANILFHKGYYGVAVFFALSGFVIAHSLTNVTATLGNFGRFLLKRSVRLDPAYWLSMIIVVAMGVLSAKIKGEVAVLPTWDQAIAHIFYIQDLLGCAPINIVYWTLPYEIQFYIFFYLLIFLPRSTAIGFVVALLSAYGIFDHVVKGLFLGLWCMFFVGVLARKALDRPIWLLAIAVLAVPLIWTPFGPFSLGTAICLWGAVKFNWPKNGLNWAWLQYLGLISYSLYLIHNPVTGAAGFLVHRFAGVGLIADIVALVVILAASIMAASLLWYFVERPSQNLSRRLRASGRENHQNGFIERDSKRLAVTIKAIYTRLFVTR